MGKSTISMAIFNSKQLVYQRVVIFGCLNALGTQNPFFTPTWVDYLKSMQLFWGFTGHVVVNIQRGKFANILTVYTIPQVLQSSQRQLRERLVRRSPNSGGTGRFKPYHSHSWSILQGGSPLPTLFSGGRNAHHLTPPALNLIMV